MTTTRKTLTGVLALADAALANGCDRAEPVLARDIAVDPRVRLKCRLNQCGQYGRNLMCPPRTWEVAETAAALARYTFALVLQRTRPATPDEGRAVFDREKLAMNDLIVFLEKEAFRLGFSLAIGLGCGHCQLCPTCAEDGGQTACRHPDRARPSPEAVGVDVMETCAAAGLPTGFVPGEVTLTALLLIA